MTLVTKGKNITRDIVVVVSLVRLLGWHWSMCEASSAPGRSRNQRESRVGQRVETLHEQSKTQEETAKAFAFCKGATFKPFGSALHLKLPWMALGISRCC